ncbi:MAG: hypothetical protein Q8O67_33045 [Deltaproteobacteria bacterium]|nr:hypothetical protein [Deltaproteobacteria bacterium]
MGWLSLDDGSWSDFWSRKYTRCIGVDGDLLVGTMKTGSKLEFVVVDPARGKKPVRYPSFAEDLADIAFSPSLVLTVQPDRKTSVPMVHLWDRASFKLSKVVPSCAAWRAAVSSSSAAVVVGDSGVVELWSDPWERARVVDTGFAGYQPVKALGFSSDGARLAVASIAEVVVVDVAAAKIIKRIACAPAGKEIEGPLRADHTSKTWVRPLLHDQLLVVDFARGVQLQEIVAELWDVAAGRRIASELVTLREGKGQGIAEQVAVSDDVVVINRDRIFRLS